MIPNLGALTIRRVCIHTVYRKEKGEEFSSVDFSDSVVELTPEVHEIITSRLATYCGDRSRAFELKITKVGEETFYNQAATLRGLNTEDFIAASKQIAQLLAKNQRKGNVQTSSLFILDAVDEDARPVVICLKAEGTDALTQEEHEGVPRLVQVKNLFMGRTEKFFKVGLIYEMAPSAANADLLPHEQWGALLYDHQFRTGTEPARYFWDGFLGFSLDHNEKLMSKHAYAALQQFAEKNFSGDVDAKSLVLNRIDEYMSNENVHTIDFEEIKNTIIPPEKRDDFNEQVHNVFTHSIAKDTALFNNKLNQARMQFQDNLVLRGTKEAFENRVDVIESQADLQSLRLDDGYTIIRIKGNPDRFLRYAKPE
jgi:37-kD nucleoid-associated bacterial protein